MKSARCAVMTGFTKSNAISKRKKEISNMMSKECPECGYINVIPEETLKMREDPDDAIICTNCHEYIDMNILEEDDQKFYEFDD